MSSLSHLFQLYSNENPYQNQSYHGLSFHVLQLLEFEKKRKKKKP